MTTPTAFEERVIALEYYVHEQLPPKMAAMNLAATRIYAETAANREAIAGLRVDMIGLEGEAGKLPGLSRAILRC